MRLLLKDVYALLVSRESNVFKKRWKKGKIERDR